MIAIQFSRTGGPEVLEPLEWPMPSPGPRQVLIKAHAIGVGMPEVLVRKGNYAWMPPLPAIPGIEMSGVVATAGAEVTSLTVGQPVFVSAREFEVRGGCYAEYLAADADRIFALPREVDLDEAAALSNYQVAWHLLHTATSGLRFNSVLVIAAAGGVGSALVQLAKLAGKRVIAVVGNAEKAAFARAQGADFVIDRSRDEVTEEARRATGGGVDLALDPVGGRSTEARFDCLAPFGMLVLYGMLEGPPGPGIVEAMKRPPQRSLAFRSFTMHTLDQMPERRRSATEELILLLAQRRIRPAIYDRLPLAQARRAHEWLESGEVMGKLILKP
jgi:NADPH:quinone reductase